MREMIRDLNKMLRERQEGKEPDFDSFMQKHGEYFPGVNSLDDLIEQMQQQMAGLEDQLSEARRMDNLEAIDSEKVKELLGDEEYQSVEQLKELMKMLEEAGYIQKRGNRWELTARGIRKIGQKALQDIFNKL